MRKSADGLGKLAIFRSYLFARRSPQVHEIRHLSYAELVGPKNDEVLRHHAAGSSALVLAWGGTFPVPNELYRKRLAELRELLEGRQVHRVGSLSGGRYPRHGRMWNAGSCKHEPLEWSAVA